MNCEQTEILISGYLDHELTQQEAQRVSLHMEGCEHCRRVHDELLSVKQQMGKLSYPESDLAMLEKLQNDSFARNSAGTGWFLLILGGILLAAMTVIEFFTADSMTWYEKLFTSLFVLGPLALLASVIRQRMLSYRNDKYRKVKL